MPPDGVGQRRQQGGGFTHPTGQRRTINVDPVAPEDLALAVEWQMVGIFVDQHMSEQSRSRPAALDRAAWQRSLREAIAARAGQARAHDAVHDKATGDIFQFLGHIFTQAAQFAAAMGADRVAGCQLDLHARNVIGDRLALGLVGGCIIRQTQLGRHCGDGDLAHLQGQLQLLGRLRR